MSWIDETLTISIIDIIEKYSPGLNLTKKGRNHQACCPFHGEKTASLMISEAKGIFKCFGCGKGGNGIGFVMEKTGLSFIDAAKDIAPKFNISIPVDSKEDKEMYDKRQRLFDALRKVSGWFESQLQTHEAAKNYALRRLRDEKTVGIWQIGYAPADWNLLRDWAKTEGLTEVLTELGVLHSKDGKIQPGFFDRLMFPVFDRYHRIIAFTGRQLVEDKKYGKYINSPESDLYKKREVWFGMQEAYRNIKEKKHAYIVEGNTDVVSLHRLEKSAVIAAMGTSISKEHIKALLDMMVSSVTLILDGDKPGQDAAVRIAPLFIKEGISVNVVNLPFENGVKTDPDSFFESRAHFNEYIRDHTQDFIIQQAKELYARSENNMDAQYQAINYLCEFVVQYKDPSKRKLYTEKLAKIIGPKKSWDQKIKELTKGEGGKENDYEIAQSIPKSVSLSDFEKYGFYQDHNAYYFRSKDGIHKGSNFVMKPLFHIKSVMNAKRLYTITNEFGYSLPIELAQRDMIGLNGFKLRVESLGNFIWEGSEIDMNRLKIFLYYATESCNEVMQLGWQREGSFWMWANGAYDLENFKPVDENGIVRNGETNYYMPALSNIFRSEETLYMSERKFVYTPGTISLHDHAVKLINVFGENAKIGLCFVIAAMFRDVIFRYFNFFPILNLFGPKGAGKTECAVSLLQFFGHQPKGPNMTNTSRPALADHIAQTCNAVAHIDEYKNNLEFEKIEFLKGLWDGTGRTRMNMDKDRKKETTAVDCAVAVSGQEMPTADIALFSRIIFLTFTQTEYSDEERLNFADLKEVEKVGLTHLTHEILQHRKYFIQHYFDCYSVVAQDITNALNGVVIEDRIFKNWALAVAAYATLKDKLVFPFSYDQLIKTVTSLIIRQNQEIKKGSEVSIFWDIVQYLTADHQIEEEVDFKVDFVNELVTDFGKIEFKAGTQVLMVFHTRLFQLYSKHGRATGANILPLKTLEYYLKNSKAYLGVKKSVSFKIRDAVTRQLDAEDADGRKKRTVTTAMCFLYEDIGVNLASSFAEETVTVKPVHRLVDPVIDFENNMPF